MRNNPTKVFGVGLPKTGTTTLGAMLRRLGYNHAPYDRQLIRRFLEGDWSALEAAIARYDSFEDWPWPLAFDKLDEIAPDAAYILTVRKDAQTWIDSAKRHGAIVSDRADKTKQIIKTGVAERAFGAGSAETNPEQWMAAYADHNDRVRLHFQARPERFIELCWETGQGWPELCAFLGHPLIEEGLPHENSHESRKLRHQPPTMVARLKRGLRKLASREGSPDQVK